MSDDRKRHPLKARILGWIFIPRRMLAIRRLNRRADRLEREIAVMKARRTTGESGGSPS